MLRLKHVATAFTMNARELSRRRIVLLLLFAIPTIFDAIAVATTPANRSVTFELAAIRAGLALEVPERDEVLVFIGVAACGLTSAFVAMTLVQREIDVVQRLVVCGYRASEIIAAKLAVKALVALGVAGVVCMLSSMFFTPRRLAATFVGLALAGWVYGCYGLLVGVLLRRELEGILAVALLTNIDAGWLQNPVSYAQAQSKSLIRALPAYWPSQATMAGAFTDDSVLVPAACALLYGAVMLALATFIFARRTRSMVGPPCVDS